MREVLAQRPKYVTLPAPLGCCYEDTDHLLTTLIFVSFQRREAIEYVLRLAKSPDRRHKALAARNLPTYYERAPDRREELHEAIYDLCEDAEPEVRAVALKTPGFLSRTQTLRDLCCPSHHN